MMKGCLVIICIVMLLQISSCIYSSLKEKSARKVVKEDIVNKEEIVSNFVSKVIEKTSTEMNRKLSEPEVKKLRMILISRLSESEIEEIVKAEQQRLETEKKKREEEEERIKKEAEEIVQAQRQKLENREAKLRDFAIKEVPGVWKTYQTLEGGISEQDQKISDLRKTLETFGKNPDEDADYKRIVSMRDEMIRSRKSLHTKLENLYLASRKYAAAPSRKDCQELQRKALEDGIQEADAAEAKFKEMRLNK